MFDHMSLGNLVLAFFMLAFFVKRLQGGFSAKLGANEYTPTQAVAWIKDVWEPEIGIAAYEEMRVAPFFKRLQAIAGTVHYRKHANLQRQALANGASARLEQLTFSGQAETQVTKTPQTSYIAVSTNLNTIARLMDNPSDTFRTSIEMSIAEGVDVVAATAFDDLVTVQGNGAAQVTEATFLDALVNLGEQAKSLWKPGTTRGVFIFHTRQVDDVLVSTQNWSQAQITGRNETPISSGWLKSVYGCDFFETGNIQNIGATFHNGLFVPELTFGIGYNQKPTIISQESGIAIVLIGWTDFAAMTLWDVYGVDYNTTVAA